MPNHAGVPRDEDDDLTPVPAAASLSLQTVIDKPLRLRPYRREEKSPAQATAEWRRAAACALTFEDKVKVFRVAYQLAEAGHMPAITFLAQYGMGKPGVGAAGKLVDDVAADTLEARLAKLPPEKLKLYLEVLDELQGNPVQEAPVQEPVTIDTAAEAVTLNEEELAALSQEEAL